MGRMKVYDATDDGDDYQQPHMRLIGWFELDRAEEFRPPRSGVETQHRGEVLYRTAGGRWVMNSWSRWQGERDIAHYVSDSGARLWLLHHEFYKEAEKYFGSIPEEFGPEGGVN